MTQIKKQLHAESHDAGRFCGYASVFGVRDRDGDIVEKGAFRDFLENLYSGKSKMPKFLWQHDLSLPIGYIDKIKEDGYGLYIEGAVLRKLQKGEEAYQLVKNKAIDGFSIGYRVLESEKIKGGKRLKKLDVFEVSLVTLASNEHSVVNEIKALKEGNMKEQNNNVLDEIKDIASDGIKDIAATGIGAAEKFLEDQIHNLSDLVSKAEKRLNIFNTKARRPDMGFPGEHMDVERKNFRDYIVQGKDGRSGVKALNAVDKDAAGYLIPEPVAEKIYSTLEHSSVIRRLANSVRISSSSLDVLVDKDMSNAGWALDDEKRDEHESQRLLKVKIPVHEVFSRTKATMRLLDDSSIDVEQWIVNRVVERFASLESEAFINGDGDHKPRGFLSYETSTDYEWGKLQEIKTGAKGAFLSQNPADVLIDLVYSLKQQYLKNACWLMSRSVISEIRKMKDASSGKYIWQPSFGTNDKPTLFGYPVEICDDMPALKRGTPSKSIVFGSFRDAYQIVDRSGVQILRDPFSAKPFVEFYITKRVGGDVVNFEALKVLNFDS